MTLSRDGAAEQVRLLAPHWWKVREDADEWQRWALGKQELPALPPQAPPEMTDLQKKAVTPWLGLIVQSLAQALVVDGYRRREEAQSENLWKVWQANRMDAKQVQLMEAMLTTGKSYVSVLPEDELLPKWRVWSSAQLTAFYDDPDDEWPELALAAVPLGKHKDSGQQRWKGWLFDNQAVYPFTADGPAGTISDPDVGEPQTHGAKVNGQQVTPVVAFVNRLTIAGHAVGEVEPYIATASRIDQDVFERLATQRFGAFRVRTATGVAEPDTDDEQRALDKQLRQGDMLVSESPDSSFGSLPETQLDGPLQAVIQDVKMLATVSQTPPQQLTGDLVNVAAEALAAILASFDRKVNQRQQRSGESYEQCFDLTAGYLDVERDAEAQVTWADHESRTLESTANALGLLAEKLEIPVEVLWDKLGYLTDQDRREAKRIREESDVFSQLLMAEQDDPAGQTAPPSA